MSALIPINNVEVSFEVVGGEIFANSLQIAKVFEKRHDNILKAVDNLPDDEFKSENFKFDSYFDKKGEQRRKANLTRDGFSLLVMGFTGEKAYRWKIEFIKAFNMMEAKLKRQGIINYTNEIANLNAVLIDKAKRHKRQINGYKSQLVQHNKQITILKHELSKFGEFDLTDPKFKPFSSSHLSYAELFKAYVEVLGNNNALKLALKNQINTQKAIKHLSLVNTKLDEAYRLIGALMAYTQGDDYFLENNEIMKG